MRVRRMMIGLGVGGGGAAATAFGLHRVYRWLRTWGAEPDEISAALPGDELCPAAAVVHSRAISVHAPPGEVWPWLTQIGQDRSGFYSYACLENGVGCRMPRVHERRAEWSTRAVGDKVLMAAPGRFGGKAYNVIAAVHPGRALVAVAPPDPPRIARSESAEWVWQLVVEPGALIGTSRLIARSRYLHRQLWLEPIHFVMERKMLRTIAELASVPTPPMTESEIGPSLAAHR